MKLAFKQINTYTYITYFKKSMYYTTFSKHWYIFSIVFWNFNAIFRYCDCILVDCASRVLGTISSYCFCSVQQCPVQSTVTAISSISKRVAFYWSQRPPIDDCEQPKRLELLAAPRRPAESRAPTSFCCCVCRLCCIEIQILPFYVVA